MGNDSRTQKAAVGVLFRSYLYSIGAAAAEAADFTSDFRSLPPAAAPAAGRGTIDAPEPAPLKCNGGGAAPPPPPPPPPIDGGIATVTAFVDFCQCEKHNPFRSADPKLVHPPPAAVHCLRLRINSSYDATDIFHTCPL